MKRTHYLFFCLIAVLIGCAQAFAQVDCSLRPRRIFSKATLLYIRFESLDSEILRTESRLKEIERNLAEAGTEGERSFERERDDLLRKKQMLEGELTRVKQLIDEALNEAGTKAENTSEPTNEPRQLQMAHPCLRR